MLPVETKELSFCQESALQRLNDFFRGEFIRLGTHNILRHRPLSVFTTIVLL